VQIILSETVIVYNFFTAVFAFTDHIALEAKLKRGIIIKPSL